MSNSRIITLGFLMVTAAAIVAAVLAVRGQGSTEVSTGTDVLASHELARVSSSADTQDPGQTNLSESISRDDGGSTPDTDRKSPPLQNSKVVTVDSRLFNQLLPKDAIAPIYQPQFSSAQDASLRPGELVIGVDINGDSRAYPIGPLNRREMVNDIVGGVPILVTW